MSSTRFALPTACCALVLMVSASGCTKAYDAWFANPCEHPVSVATFGQPEPSGDPIAEVDVPARSSVEVKTAFFNAAGYEWAIVVNDGEPVLVDWEQFKRERGTVVIPASECRR